MIKKLAGSVCLAVACLVATTCRADDKIELAIEAPYWLLSCEPEFKATPGLTESVYGFTLGVMSGFVEAGNKEALTKFVEASAKMADEGARDRDAGRFTRTECATMVADFASQWNRLP